MDAKQIYMALRALDPNISILLTDTRLKSGEQWYVSASLEASDGEILSTISGHADTPEEALQNAWVYVLKAKNIYTKGNRYRWNGFMWEQLVKAAVQ